MLKSMRKSKNRYFYHIFVSPGDAPLTITVSEIERDIGENNGRKAGFFIPPLHSTPPNIGTPFGTEKLEWCRYPMVKKIRRYV